MNLLGAMTLLYTITVSLFLSLIKNYGQTHIMDYMLFANIIKTFFCDKRALLKKHKIGL